MGEEIKKLENMGKTPIIMTSPIVRMYFKRLTVVFEDMPKAGQYAADDAFKAKWACLLYTSAIRLPMCPVLIPTACPLS